MWAILSPAAASPCPAGLQHRETDSEVMPDSVCVLELVQKLPLLISEHLPYGHLMCPCLGWQAPDANVVSEGQSLDPFFTGAY